MPSSGPFPDRGNSRSLFVVGTDSDYVRCARGVQSGGCDLGLAMGWVPANLAPTEPALSVGDNARTAVYRAARLVVSHRRSVHGEVCAPSRNAEKPAALEQTKPHMWQECVLF